MTLIELFVGTGILFMWKYTESEMTGLESFYQGFKILSSESLLAFIGNCVMGN